MPGWAAWAVLAELLTFQRLYRKQAVSATHNISYLKTTKNIKLVLSIVALLPMASAQCPACNDAITWSGPCTYETTLTETGCELNDMIIGFVEELKEACDATAL